MDTGKFDGPDFPFRAAFTKSARDQNTADMVKRLDGRVLFLEQFGIDPFDPDLGAVGDAAMDKRLAKRFVGILERGVFADNGDGHLAVRVGKPLADAHPA